VEAVNQFFQARAAEMWIGLAFLVLILEVWVVILHRRISRLQVAQQLRQRTSGALMSSEDHAAIVRLQAEMPKNFQKIGLVRFNPFGDTGGDQSFAIALTDAEGNGFVISSLHRRTESKVYAKPLKDWQSSYTLSDEEKQAISLARDGELENTAEA
jgi:hypothetical protein